MFLRDIDQEAFSTSAEPYRRELQVHCYRMMGTVQDAEDMVQETFLRRDSAEDQATFRAWLYKIATNVCLDALRKRSRLVVPMTYQAASSPLDPLPAAIHEPIWLEPYPDDLLVSSDETPEAQFAAQEHISLAFITALHLLPPRQRAILILRDVLDWEASEVAELLDTSVASVKSALHRARKTLAAHQSHEREADEPKLTSTALQTQVDRFVRAWEMADVNTLVQMLKADATFSMPPIPTWYRGWEAIREAMARNAFYGLADGRWRLLTTRANGQPAFGLYRLDEAEGIYRAVGIGILTFQGSRIADMTIFGHSNLFTDFGLPTTLR